MMPATSRGIYHNLKESKYVVSNGEITLFFSSKVYMHKFMERYHKHRIEFLEKLEKVMLHTTHNMMWIADITLYNEIEKRGFYSLFKGSEVNCLELHVFALEKSTKSSITKWYVIQEPKLIELKRITI